MEQAIGHCGGSQARTEMFRTSHEDFRGKIKIKQENNKNVNFQEISSSRIQRKYQ